VSRLVNAEKPPPRVFPEMSRLMRECRFANTEIGVPGMAEAVFTINLNSEVDLRNSGVPVTGQSSGGLSTMGWPPSGTMHGSYASNGANGTRWRPMKMGITEMDIGNHRAPITPIARITPSFFCPMVVDDNSSWANPRLTKEPFTSHLQLRFLGLPVISKTPHWQATH
jgi:hypothetical protein